MLDIRSGESLELAVFPNKSVEMLAKKYWRLYNVPFNLEYKYITLANGLKFLDGNYKEIYCDRSLNYGNFMLGMQILKDKTAMLIFECGNKVIFYDLVERKKIKEVKLNTAGTVRHALFDDKTNKIYYSSANPCGDKPQIIAVKDLTTGEEKSLCELGNSYCELSFVCYDKFIFFIEGAESKLVIVENEEKFQVIELDIPFSKLNSFQFDEKEKCILGIKREYENTDLLLSLPIITPEMEEFNKLSNEMLELTLRNENPTKDMEEKVRELAKTVLEQSKNRPAVNDLKYKDTLAEIYLDGTVRYEEIATRNEPIETAEMSQDSETYIRRHGITKEVLENYDEDEILHGGYFWSLDNLEKYAEQDGKKLPEYLYDYLTGKSKEISVELILYSVGWFNAELQNGGLRQYAENDIGHIERGLLILSLSQVNAVKTAETIARTLEPDADLEEIEESLGNEDYIALTILYVKQVINGSETK